MRRRAANKNKGMWLWLRYSWGGHRGRARNGLTLLGNPLEKGSQRSHTILGAIPGAMGNAGKEGRCGGEGRSSSKLLRSFKKCPRVDQKGFDHAMQN